MDAGPRGEDLDAGDAAGGGVALVDDLDVAAQLTRHASRGAEAEHAAYSSPVRSFLILHGWQGSGPDHWQTWLAERLAARRRAGPLSGPARARPPPTPTTGPTSSHGELAELAGETHRRLPLAGLPAVGARGRAIAARRARRPRAARRAAVPGHADRRRRRPLPHAARRAPPSHARRARRGSWAAIDDPYCPAGHERSFARAARPADRRARGRGPHQPRGGLRAVARGRGVVPGGPADRSGSEERRRDVALAASRAGSPRSACPPTPAAGRPRSRPHSAAPQRDPAQHALGAAPRRARCRSRPRRRTGITSSMTSRSSTAGTNPRRCPGSCAARAGGRDSTARRRGLDRHDAHARAARALRYSPTPVMVPPVPTPATSTSTSPSAPRGSRARWCAGGPRGSPGWRTGRAGRRRRVRGAPRAASTASFMPPIDSMTSTRAP